MRLNPLLTRRKLAVFLITSSLILLTLWTWTFLGINKGINVSGHFFEVYNNKKHQNILHRFIVQANRVLHNQLESVVPATNPSESFNKLTKQESIVRFLNPSETGNLVINPQKRDLKAKRNKIVGESYLFEEERLKILENQQRSRYIGAEDMDIGNNMDYERELTSFERQTQYERELQRMGVPFIAGIGPDEPHVPKDRLIHLDLKGAPPKLSFLKMLLPVLRSLGATGLLIEYEDMFPYTGVLQAIAARNAYNNSELLDFLETSAALGLSVMPLVQTFGHIEFALKLQGFEHMREVSESPQSICPSKKESLVFLQEMLTEIIEFHLRVGNDLSRHPDTSQKSFTHIHIGCDEVYRMGNCNDCRLRTKNEIFLTHVTTLASWVRAKWPHLKVVIWDDMLRGMTLSELQHSNVGQYVEPMIWVYANDIYHYIQPHLWDIYAKVFPTAWAASAFKGAFGENLMIPPIQRHLENNIRWLAVIAKEGERFSKGFKGLALTGWQRYDHFAVLCELLPIAIPSLITSLSTVSKGYFSTDPKDNAIMNVLQCAFHTDSRRSGSAWLELQPHAHHSQLFSSCDYLGSGIYKYTLRLWDKLIEAQAYLGHVHDKSAWMSSYNVRHNFSSPLRVRDLTVNTQGVINELTCMSKEAHNVMIEAFDEHTIAEFIEQNIYPIIVSLRTQLSNGDMLMQRKVWPQRPLPYARELIDLNLIPGKPEALRD